MTELFGWNPHASCATIRKNNQKLYTIDLAVYNTALKSSPECNFVFKTSYSTWILQNLKNNRFISGGKVHLLSTIQNSFVLLVNLEASNVVAH